MSGDKKDPPIAPLDYVSGMKVVDIGDVRVARGQARRHHSSCPHRRMIYDTHERRIWCSDCERDVETFDAFKSLVEQYYYAHDALEKRAKDITEAEAFNIRSIAAKTIDQAWRSRSMVPACPHCSSGLFPEDFKSRPTMLGKDYARALASRRRRPSTGDKP